MTTLNDITFHIYFSSQIRVYAKDSFDRFGDDLTELILSYLTLEDKVRLECVSKQWRRLVFSKQLVIEIIDIKVYRFYNKTNNSLNKLYRRIDKRILFDSLKLFLKKCPNIRKINFMVNVNSDVLSLIGQYYPHIKSLTLHSLSYGVQYLDFFLKYGHKLEELIIYQDFEYLKKYLKLCPNLKKFKAHNLSLLNEDEEFLPKLEYFENFDFGYDLCICSENINQMKIFSNKYNRTTKRLNVYFGHLTEEEFKKGIECISRFKSLRELEFVIGFQKMTEPIDDCLSLIGQKCNKLLKLDLVINSLVTISDRFFDVFTEFKAINKLIIMLRNNKVLSAMVL